MYLKVVFYLKFTLLNRQSLNYRYRDLNITFVDAKISKGGLDTRVSYANTFLLNK